MTQKIDIAKKYATRDGREVIIEKTDGLDNMCPVIGYVKEPTAVNRWVNNHWDEFGRHPLNVGGYSQSDLIEVKEKKRLEGWYAAHGGSLIGPYESSDLAKQNYPHAVAIFDISKFEVEYEIGEGL